MLGRVKWRMAMILTAVESALLEPDRAAAASKRRKPTDTAMGKAAPAAVSYLGLGATLPHACATPVAPAQSIMGLPAASSFCRQVLSCLTGGAAGPDSGRPGSLEPHLVGWGRA